MWVPMPFRRLILLALIAVALPAPAAGALPARSQVKVRLVDCATAAAQSARFAVFEGEMRSIAGAARMQLRLTLQARTPGRGWTRVSAPGFGVWSTAAPGVRRFVHTKRVENLLAPAHYRVLAKARWLDFGGATIKALERRTTVCSQPDPRADLTPVKLDIRPGSDETTRTYLVPVLNAGRLTAGGFTIALTVNDRRHVVQAPGGLKAGERTLIGFEGPACAPGSAISVVVDSDGVIDEADEADNSLTASCLTDD